MENKVRLDKLLSYLLRHNPSQIQIKMDKEGRVNLLTLVDNLSKYLDIFITREEIVDIVNNSEKKRYVIEKTEDNVETIRALYGHSIVIDKTDEETKPPKYLYHGTTSLYLRSIFRIGLTPQQRQFVHLSNDLETATNVGKRRTDSPIIIRVLSEEAYKDGIKFYKELNNVWLTKEIPPKYLQKLT